MSTCQTCYNWLERVRIDDSHKPQVMSPVFELLSHIVAHALKM